MPNPKTLRKMIVLPVLFASTAFANDKPPPAAQDTWNGSDKKGHFFMGTVISGAVTVATEKPLLGFGAGCAAGALKEAADTKFSAKDMAVTCLGAGFGAYGANWLITRQGGKTTLSYSKEF